jgi:hypothetical protein
MRRGTTPTHTFEIPLETSNIAKIRVSYAQGGVVKVVKKESDCELLENTIVVKLTQSETLRLNHRLRTEIQVKVLTRDGDTFVSDVIEVNTDRCLNDEVL